MHYVPGEVLWPGEARRLGEGGPADVLMKMAFLSICIKLGWRWWRRSWRSTKAWWSTLAWWGGSWWCTEAWWSTLAWWGRSWWCTDNSVPISTLGFDDDSPVNSWQNWMWVQSNHTGLNIIKPLTVKVPIRRERIRDVHQEGKGRWKLRAGSIRRVALGWN